MEEKMLTMKQESEIKEEKKAASLRNLPFASMLNAYMGYSLIRNELARAIEYSNIMQSAHSILRVADADLGTFETRFAKPTKQAQAVLDRLGVKFTEMRNIEGVMVEKLRPIADIFEDLNKKGASMADMQAIFGKIGGNAAMMFMDILRVAGFTPDQYSNEPESNDTRPFYTLRNSRYESNKHNHHKGSRGYQREWLLQLGVQHHRRHSGPCTDNRIQALYGRAAHRRR